MKFHLLGKLFGKKAKGERVRYEVVVPMSGDGPFMRYVNRVGADYGDNACVCYGPDALKNAALIARALNELGE